MLRQWPPLIHELSRVTRRWATLDPPIERLGRGILETSRVSRLAYTMTIQNKNPQVSPGKMGGLYYSDVEHRKPPYYCATITGNRSLTEVCHIFYLLCMHVSPNTLQAAVVV